VVEAGPPPPAAVEQLPTVVPPAAPPVAVVEQFATAAPPDAPPVSRTRQPAAYGAKQGDSRILLRANADTWIQVQAVGQDPLFSKMLREGDSYYVPNRPDLLLTTGNAGGVEMFVDGKPLPPLGPSGAIRRNIPLEPGILGASAIGN
jgi:cytoskeleton protein RodZ